MPLSIGGHKWSRLLLVAVVLYIALLPLWWYAIDALGWVAAYSADAIYHFLDPLVSIRPDGKVVNVSVTASAESGFGGEARSTALRVDTVTYGLPMLVALVLVTRADSLRAKSVALAAGSLLMLIASVLAVMLGAKMASLQLDDQIALANYSKGGDRSSFFYYAFHGYAFSQPVLAVAIWIALMMLGLFKGRGKAKTPAVAVARNAPCPCGSGRKYKRCCGRS